MTWEVRIIQNRSGFGGQRDVTILNHGNYSEFGLVCGDSVFACCGLFSMKGFSLPYKLPRRYNEPVQIFAPTPGIITSYINAQVRTWKHREPGKDAVGAITTAQINEHNGFWKNLGILEFEGLVAPNRVHGPNDIHILRIQPSKWLALWRSKYKTIYTDWYNEQKKNNFKRNG